jgi:hypothetical protein
LDIKESFKEALLGKKGKKTQDFQEQTLGKRGVEIARDQKLEHRIALLIRLEEEVSKPITETDQLKRLEKMREKLHLLNHGIFQISWPYARGASDQRFGKAIDGWTSKVYPIAESWILQGMKMLQQKTVEQKKAQEDEQVYSELGENIGNLETGDIEMQLQFLERNLETYVHSEAFFLLALPFLDKDVSPQAVTVIQTMISPKGAIPSFYEDGLQKSE